LHEKRLYLSLELVSQFEKSGEVALRVNLWIIGINIKPLIGPSRQTVGRRGELRGRIV
jgi:hypothetical protein